MFKNCRERKVKRLAGMQTFVRYIPKPLALFSIVLLLEERGEKILNACFLQAEESLELEVPPGGPSHLLPQRASPQGSFKT